MIVYLSLIFLFGIITKLGYTGRLEKWVNPKVLWRDIFFLSFIVSLYIEQDKNPLLLSCGFPLAILFTKFAKKETNNNDAFLYFLFLAFPATVIFGLDSKTPFLLSSLFSVVYCFRENLKNTKIATLFLVLFWIVSIKFQEGVFLSLIAPLGLALAVLKGMSSKKEPALEYAFLISSIGLVVQMDSLPMWLKASVAFLLLAGLILSKLSFIRLISWSTITIPLFLSIKSEGVNFQLYTFLVLPIIYEILRVLIKELMNFKISGSNEVVMSYQQIVLIALLALMFGGFRGTIFSIVFPEILDFSYGLYLFLLIFVVPIKHQLVTDKPLEFRKQDEFYFITRSVLLFVVLFICSGSSSIGYNYFPLVVLILGLGLGFLFRTKKGIEDNLRLVIQKIEISLGDTYKLKQVTSFKIKRSPEKYESYERWHGYSYSFEISLVFLGLLFLIYWGGL